MQYRFDLTNDEVPTKWYNINADFLNQEFATERYIKIPNEVRELYQRLGRPTPLVRAKGLEEKLNTPAKIYYKREDTSPTGSHKLNSAIAQAYYAKKEGIERITTETGAGQWGTALSLAASMMGLDCTVYMVRVSYDQKPFRKTIMQLYDGEVHASPSEKTEVGRKGLAETPDTPGSLGIAISSVRKSNCSLKKLKKKQTP